MTAMRTRLTTLIVAFSLLLVAAPAAFAHDGGEGWYGETNDKAVTNAGFILIISFPLIVFLISMIQGRLDKRKDARKRAAKARSASRQWQGGW
jgi:hypothetical protein